MEAKRGTSKFLEKAPTRGGLSAVLGTVIAGSAFLPVTDRVLSATDEALSLGHAFAIGFIVSGFFSPIAFGVGYIFGKRIGNRRPSGLEVVRLAAVGALCSSLPLILTPVAPVLAGVGVAATLIALVLFTVLGPKEVEAVEQIDPNGPWLAT